MRMLKKISILVIIIFCICILPSLASTGTAKGDFVNVRKEANTTSEVVITIEDGTKVDIIEKSGDWYKVKVSSKTGYIREDLLTITEEVPSTIEPEQPNKVETPKETIGDIDVHLIPLINSTVINKVKSTDEILIRETINGWKRIQVGNISGWIRKEALEKKEDVITPIEQQHEEGVDEAEKKVEQPTTQETSTQPVQTTKIGYINTDNVNLRKEPSTTAEVVGEASKNTEIEIIEELDGWYKIKVEEKTVYVANWLISNEKVPVTTNRGLETPRTEEISTTITNSNGRSIIEYAKQFLGCSYVYGGSGPSSFDCSGFTMYVFNQYGYSMSHSATAQSRLGEYVAYEDLQPGDLVFFKDYQTMQGIGHCGIYVGDGDFIHATSGTGYCVKISTLLSGSYLTRYETARRLI